MPRETSVKNISRIGVSKLGVFAYPREKVQSMISSRLENDPLPLLSALIDNRPTILLAAKTYGSVFHFGGFRVKNYSKKPFRGRLRVNFRTCTACTPLWDN